MLFKGVDRVVIVVWDHRQAVDRFSKLFGIEFDVAEDTVEQVWVAQARSKFGLEVISPISTAGSIGAHLTQKLEERGEGLDVVVVRVDDLDAAVEAFRNMGMEPTGRMDHGSHREANYAPEQAFGIGLVLNEYEEPHPCHLETMRFLGGLGDAGQ
jgi:hypothetical protein